MVSVLNQNKQFHNETYKTWCCVFYDLKFEVRVSRHGSIKLKMYIYEGVSEDVREGVSEDVSEGVSESVKM